MSDHDPTDHDRIAHDFIDHVVTSGTFSLDGQTFDVDNNVWIVGDDSEVAVIDAAHDADAILAAVGDRTLAVIVSTHGHDDHIDAAREVSERTGAPVLLHPEDRVLWDMHYDDHEPDGDLADGDVIDVGGRSLEVLHTPGHSPGAVCLYDQQAGVLFSGDTLFRGGPGATGRSYSDFDTIVASIRQRLLVLPDDTVVHTGHGDTTTIGAEHATVDQAVADAATDA